MKLVILFILFAYNVNAMEYTVGCYGDTELRAINGTYPTYEDAQKHIDDIALTDPTFDCDILEKEELEEE